MDDLKYTNRSFGEQNYDRIEFLLDHGLAFSLIKVSGGSFFTALPISDFEYRAHTPTRAKLLEHSSFLGVHTFRLSDDWGDEYSFQIDEIRQPEELKKLLDSDIYKSLIPKGVAYWVGNFQCSGLVDPSITLPQGFQIKGTLSGRFEQPQTMPRVPVCDCGAAKVGTGHAYWCSLEEGKNT